jgi:hypothetical protein
MLQRRSRGDHLSQENHRRPIVRGDARRGDKETRRGVTALDPASRPRVSRVRVSGSLCPKHCSYAIRPPRRNPRHHGQQIGCEREHTAPPPLGC